MLFPYKFVPHQMEKMQTFIDYIYIKVWCEAPSGHGFSVDLFDGCPELKAIIQDFYFSTPSSAEFFFDKIEPIYYHFASFNVQEIDQLKGWYHGNNDIEKACANDPDLSIARYSDIKQFDPGLCALLEEFFKGLYSPNFLRLKVLRDRIGNIDDSYRIFMTENSAGKCPFCGISDIKGVDHKYREAYDHYLPKKYYPFNTLNFWNLAPTCHECNSTYKLSVDPLHNQAGRRKSFFPFSDQDYRIDIRIELQNQNWENILPDQITLEFGPNAISEEIETWKEVYGIEERYKAKCCGENDGSYWIEQALGELRNKGHSPHEIMKDLKENAAHHPYAEINFLKFAFLEGCDRAGLFDVDSEDD